LATARVEAQPPLRLLLAEDNGVNRMVLEKILALGGHRTKIVADGEAALDAMLTERFDVILLDVNMPGIDGPEVARLYRFTPGRPHAPIIALTADASSACREECARAGMVACLIKPLAPEILLRAVANAFAARRDQALVRNTRAADDPDGYSVREPLDPAALAALLKLGGADFLHELIGQFLDEGKRIVERMAVAVEGGDLSAFQHEAHALASSAGNVGALGLARLCRSWGDTTMETFALYGDDLLDDLRREWSGVAAVLNRMLAKGGSSRGGARHSRRDDAAA
jgi:two-component system sensor histidine kinase RpfC